MPPLTFERARTARKKVRLCGEYKSLAQREALIEVRPIARAVPEGLIVRRADDGRGLIRRELGLALGVKRHVSQPGRRVIKEPVEHCEDMRTGSDPSLCRRCVRCGRCQRSSADVLAGSSVSPVGAGDGDKVVCTVRPSPHQLGLAIGQRRAPASGTYQRWNPVVMAGRAAQRTQGKLGAESIGDGRSAANAPRSERRVVQRVAFDDQPLKPRCMKTRPKTAHAVAQLGARAS